MDNPSTNKKDDELEEKHPKLWGAFYIVLGIAGLAFSVYGLIQSLEMVPLFGSVTAGMLIGLLSIIIIIYGFRVFKRDY